jgi:hypothetical protein
MAYATVPTVATGDLWTAANHNSYIRDNFAAGVPDIFTTKGDLAVATGPDAAARLAAGSDGQIMQVNAAAANGLQYADDVKNVEFLLDGGGGAITVGIKGELFFDFNAYILGVTLLADQAGSLVVDLWKQAYGSYPPSDANSITAAAPPTLSTANKMQDFTLTGWTRNIVAGDCIRINVDSCTTITRCLIALKIKRTP